MIKLKQQGEVIFELGFVGAQPAGACAGCGGGAIVVPFAARLKAIYARLGTAGVTGTLTVDVFNNGVTLLSSGTMLSFASASKTPTYATNFAGSNPPTFAKGDVITLSLSAPQTTPAKDLVVIIVLERQRAGSWNDAVQTDTIGADSDAI